MKRPVLTVLLALGAAVAVGLVLAWPMLGGGRGRTAAEGVALPCLLSFRMDGCVPCERTRPAVKAVKAKYAGRLRVESVDINRHPELKTRFGVQAVPTLILFDVAGREVLRHQGAATPEALEGLLTSSNLLAGGPRAAGTDDSLEALVAMLVPAPELKTVPAPSADGAVAGVRVYYFHGDVRSGCSQEVENTTREVVTQEFRPLLKGRELAWTTLNIEAAENAQWVKTFDLKLNEYDLTRGIAVLVRSDGNKPVHWKVIGDLASYRMDLDKLREYVRGETGGFVKAEFR